MVFRRLAPSLLDHPGVGGPGVGQGDEELFGIGPSDEIRDAQSVERPADTLPLPATLYDQGQRGERRVDLADTETSSRSAFSKASKV